MASLDGGANAHVLHEDLEPARRVWTLHRLGDSWTRLL